MLDQLELPFIKIRVGRFLFLLISLMLWLVLRPFLENYIGISTLMDIFITIIFISGVYAVSQKGFVFMIGLFIAIISVTIRWTNHFLNVFPLEVASNILNVLFLGFVVGIIMVYLFREKQITGDMIIGAICVYFLIGMMWAVGYNLMEMFEPGTFQLPEGLEAGISHFSYYSFVTLTTLGYGDITPVSHSARSLSTLEAAMGQLYLAVLIARLVGVHVSQSHGSQSK